MYDLMIVGAGPAGLCAAVYAARKQLKTLLVSIDIGGQINRTWGIENYLGYQFIEGPELISKFEQQVKQFPIDRKIGHAITGLSAIDGGFEATADNGERYQARSVILATGKKPQKLNIPGESELSGRGVTYCSICDGPIFAGQRVAIVGGGNSAVSSALDMVKIAEHVDLVSLTQLTADPVLVEQLKGIENLSIYAGYQTLKIEGKGLVEGIVIKSKETGGESRLKGSGVFIEIGLNPNSEPVKNLLPLNRIGEVPVSCWGETTTPGLYAAGDVTDVPEKQIIIAAGEGAKVALQVHRFLQRKGNE